MTRSSELLDSIIDRLHERTDVQAVWLAGSRGRGSDDDLSDLDLWIVLDDTVIANVVADPLAWIHVLVPTIMHAVVPANGPAGGTFVGSWVPVDDAFVQVDWYFAPRSSAVREADTHLVYGHVPLAAPVDPVRLPEELAASKISDNLVLALQMVNNLVKYARRGQTWRAADHARHADKCLANATWLLDHGTEPGYAAGKTTFLPEPVRIDAGGIRTIARVLLEATETIAARANLTSVVYAPVAAMQAVIQEWGDAAFVPPDEYYRSLARRRLGAGVLITDADGRILMLETTYKQTYEIPGGACEAGESPRETARREVQEELGLEINVGRLLVFDHRSEPEPKGDAIMLVYDGGIIDDPSLIVPDGKEISAWEFVEPAVLEQVTTARMAARLREALQARSQNGVVEIADGAVVP